MEGEPETRKYQLVKGSIINVASAAIQCDKLENHALGVVSLSISKALITHTSQSYSRQLCCNNHMWRLVVSSRSCVTAAMCSQASGTSYTKDTFPDDNYLSLHGLQAAFTFNKFTFTFLLPERSTSYCCV